MTKTPLTREQLEAHWMPYTGNRQFKRDPRIIVAAEGVHFIDDQGRRILDGLSGLWCCGAGDNRPEIRDAVESIFDVTVTKVNTLNRKGKRMRNRRDGTFGKRSDEKRPYVTLLDGDSIDLFEV